MGTHVGVGVSHQRHPVRAAQEAVKKALTAAAIEQPDFVFVFASLGYDADRLVQSIREVTGYCSLSGCSGQGVIVQGEADESGFSVAVMVIKSDEIRFTNQILSHHNLNANEALSFEDVGKTLGHKIQMEMPTDPIALFLFTDGLTLNFDRLAVGLQSVLLTENFLPFFGGAAGSNAAMQITYQFCDDQVLSNGTVATLMSGSAQIAWAANHGCVPIGTECQVTRAEGNLVYELDHKPVFEVLREYLSEDEIARWDRTIVSFCFGIKPTNGEEFMIRYLPRKDEAAGAVMLQTEIVKGTKIWVMRRDQDEIIEGTKVVAQSLNSQLNGKNPKFILHFDCYGRGKSVFTEQQKQRLLKELQQDVGPTLPWIGVYTHGEISPIEHKNSFHNYTIVLAAIY